MAEPRDVHVNLKLDTSQFALSLKQASLSARSFSESMDRLRATLAQNNAEWQRRVQLFMHHIEVLGKTEDQVWAIYYTRGGMDARYELPADRDAYLRVLLKVGPMSAAAVDGFLSGWANHRGQDPVEPATWHRYLAGTRVEVSIG